MVAECGLAVPGFVDEEMAVRAVGEGGGKVRFFGGLQGIGLVGGVVPVLVGAFDIAEPELGGCGQVHAAARPVVLGEFVRGPAIGRFSGKRGGLASWG